MFVELSYVTPYVLTTIDTRHCTSYEEKTNPNTYMYWAGEISKNSPQGMAQHWNTSMDRIVLKNLSWPIVIANMNDWPRRGFLFFYRTCIWSGFYVYKLYTKCRKRGTFYLQIHIFDTFLYIFGWGDFLAFLSHYFFITHSF